MHDDATFLHRREFDAISVQTWTYKAQRDDRYRIQRGRLPLFPSSILPMSASQFYPLERHPRTGEPFLRLPAPLDQVIVTPPRREDVRDIVAILNDYPIKRWLDGPPFPYLEMHAEDWIAKTLEQSDAVMQQLRAANETAPEGPLASVSGCPVGCLRGVEQDGREVYLGAIEFTRCGFPDLLNRAEQEREVSRNESRQCGDPDIVWCIGCKWTVPRE